MKKYIVAIFVFIFLMAWFSYWQGFDPCLAQPWSNDCCEFAQWSDDCCDLNPSHRSCEEIPDPNIQLRKDRCPGEASKIDSFTINYINEISPWVCCFEDGSTKPKCSDSNLDCVWNGWQTYGRGWLWVWNKKCCPIWWTVYDKDSVTDNYAKCCEGTVYSKTIAPEQVWSLWPTEDNSLSCCIDWNAVVKDSEWKYSCKSCSSLKSQVQSLWTWEWWDIKDIYIQYCSTDPATCPANQLYTDEAWASKCCEWLLEDNKCYVNTEWTAGIEMDPDCLMNGQCKFNIYDTLGIRQSLPEDTRSSPWIFIQDIILSATFFVGTVITIVLIISWLLFVFSGINQDLHSKAKKWITGSLIWLLFVSWSYAFVRLIQFLVTWGGG